MNCVYCGKPLPARWYEFHCIPVARGNGGWIDMYNRLDELTAPIDQVAHWACHIQNQAEKQGSPHDRVGAGARRGPTDIVPDRR